MPFLEMNGTRYELREPETTVGSGAQATWRVASHDLAAKHFQVLLDETGAAALRPCSDYGVVVLNGHQAPPTAVPLASGDIIAAGTARFRFLADDASAAPLPPEGAPPTAHLIDEEAQGAYQLTHRTVTIGRDTSSVIRMRDPRISRFHADIRMEAGVFVLYPLGSHGTYVNGERIAAPHVLREGDRIGIGGMRLRFTRQALPEDVHPAEGELDPDDPQSMRATLLHAAVSTGEHPAAARAGRTWLLALTAAVILALLGVLLLI